MPVLLESPSRPLSIKDVATISTQLAEDLSKLMIKSEGFSIDDYLTLTGNYLVEYVDGRIQVLPMPTLTHQRLIRYLDRGLGNWTEKNDPKAITVFAPFFVKISASQYREPDVSLMLGKNVHRCHEESWDGADLVVEVVSESNRKHDVETKRAEYALGGIPEYWIVDPLQRWLTVLTLRGSEYVEHGVFVDGERATSALLPSFSVDVSQMFDEAERRAG